jgi:F-type H+-transporting ATPase subunit alpha
MAVENGLLDRLARRVEDYRLTLRLGEKGRVASVGDGIAWVYGLPSAAVDEILHFEDGSRGLVFELQKERLGVILLDPAANIASGSLVSHTGERLEIGVGDALLGRVVDPLGKPLDGLPPFEADGFCALEGPSPPHRRARFRESPALHRHQGGGHPDPHRPGPAPARYW